MYYVKTTSGYYYAETNGKYGRFNGSKEEAWVLCWKHAESLCTTLNQYAPEAMPELEENTSDSCKICETRSR